MSNQASNLVRALRNITADVKLGFGAFVDKPVLPFVSSSHLRPYVLYKILLITEKSVSVMLKYD